MSKVYEMWNPYSWIIYDSYGVRGLQWLVSQVWDSTGQKAHESFLKFPFPPGRANSAIQGFPVLGSRLQSALGFIYTSWLARAIAEQLNETNTSEFVWYAYHVEMALFQLGYEI